MVTNSPLAQSPDIVHNHHVLHDTELLKVLAQILGGDIEEKVSDVYGGLRHRSFAHVLTTALALLLGYNGLHVSDIDSLIRFLGQGVV